MKKGKESMFLKYGVCRGISEPKLINKDDIITSIKITGEFLIGTI